MPYRDSKLTHLLSDSLGGDSKCALVQHASHIVKLIQPLHGVCMRHAYQPARNYAATFVCVDARLSRSAATSPRRYVVQVPDVCSSRACLVRRQRDPLLAQLRPARPARRVRPGPPEPPRKFGKRHRRKSHVGLGPAAAVPSPASAARSHPTEAPPASSVDMAFTSLEEDLAQEDF